MRLSEPASYDDVFSLAQEHRLTVYDAAYPDLAIQERLPLANLDVKASSTDDAAHLYVAQAKSQPKAKAPNPDEGEQVSKSSRAARSTA